MKGQQPLNSDTNISSFKNYALHGAFGLLMGVGIGTVLTFLLLNILSPLEFIIPSSFGDPLTFLMRFSSNFIIFTVFGIYMGHIAENEKEFARLGAAAGIFCGIAAGVLGGILTDYETARFAVYITVLGIAGLVFGVPRIRSMVLLAVSGLLGGLVGTAIYFLAQYLTYFLKDVGMQHNFNGVFPILCTLLLLILTLLAIGIAGSSIGVGIYIAGGRAYSKRDAPLSLKIMRYLGLGLVMLVLLFMTVMFISIADYASTSASIRMSSGTGETTLYVPVLLDDGELLEMYEHPTVNGDAATAIIDTPYGKALRITGSGDVEIQMQQSLGIQRGKQPYEAFGGFSLSMGNYTVGENDRMTDIRIYTDGEVDDIGIYFSLDTGWGQILKIATEKDIDPVEGWQVVRLDVSVLCYD